MQSPTEALSEHVVVTFTTRMSREECQRIKEDLRRDLAALLHCDVEDVVVLSIHGGEQA